MCVCVCVVDYRRIEQRFLGSLLKTIYLVDCNKVSYDDWHSKRTIKYNFITGVHWKSKLKNLWIVLKGNSWHFSVTFEFKLNKVYSIKKTIKFARVSALLLRKFCCITIAASVHIYSLNFLKMSSKIYLVIFVFWHKQNHTLFDPQWPKQRSVPEKRYSQTRSHRIWNRRSWKCLHTWGSFFKEDSL